MRVPASGYNATLVDAGPYTGMNANEWAADVFVPDAMPQMVANAVAVIVGLWEFIVGVPGEYVIWRRIFQGPSGRSSFAPWTTLALRYLMLTLSVSQAFGTWSTTMKTVAACKVASGTLGAAGLLLNSGTSFAVAWRAQAVARGVIQTAAGLVLVRLTIAGLLVVELFLVWFTVLFPSTRNAIQTDRLRAGRCVSRTAASGTDQIVGRPPEYRILLICYYGVTILFNFACLIIVCVALRRLARRSHGFARFISEMVLHSVFFFLVSVLLLTLGLIWIAIDEYAGWIFWPASVIQAATMVRILISEQNAARRPLDTTFMEQSAYPNTGGTTGRGPTYGAYFSRGAPVADHMRGPEAPVEYATGDHAQRGETTVQFADRYGGPLSATGMLSRRGGGRAPPILNPLDNLGQAFSQIDSRMDIDEQSFDDGRSSLRHSEGARADGTSGSRRTDSIALSRLDAGSSAPKLGSGGSTAPSPISAGAYPYPRPWVPPSDDHLNMDAEPKVANAIPAPPPEPRSQPQVRRSSSFSVRSSDESYDRPQIQTYPG
ncbi:hypothetical protein CBOM_04033 [Ceraceosorus bombacis]|uniref:Transmembrane protein n=1 Tax=Ceraceosorus bombacis TaxID=401625 RepID=A0A0P1BNX1_9BASI|nr:hypothetical protein CBOM_04033 [Ceraceosorus bombacis]